MRGQHVLVIVKLCTDLWLGPKTAADLDDGQLRGQRHGGILFSQATDSSVYRLAAYFQVQASPSDKG